jgi:hypothetical protein
MSDLEKLLAALTPDCQKAARLGYALGYIHAASGQSEQLPWSPEWRAVEDITGCEPGTW